MQIYVQHFYVALFIVCVCVRRTTLIVQYISQQNSLYIYNNKHPLGWIQYKIHSPTVCCAVVVKQARTRGSVILNLSINFKMHFYDCVMFYYTFVFCVTRSDDDGKGLNFSLFYLYFSISPLGMVV